MLSFLVRIEPVFEEYVFIRYGRVKAADHISVHILELREPFRNSGHQIISHHRLSFLLQDKYNICLNSKLVFA